MNNKATNQHLITAENADQKIRYILGSMCLVSNSYERIMEAFLLFDCETPEVFDYVHDQLMSRIAEERNEFFLENQWLKKVNC